MKALIRLTLAVVLAAVPMVAATSDGDTESHAVMGIRATYVDGSPDKVAEYESLDRGPFLGFLVHTHQDWGSLLVSAHAWDRDDNEAKLAFDIGRVVRSETDWNKLLHRLGHDPMTNLEATSINGKVVYHTDTDPLRDYEITWSELANRTEIQFPHLSALTLAVNYREQTRYGHRQAYTTSHCDTCHVTSQTHGQDEKTQDVGLEAQVAWQSGYVQAAVTSRELRQKHSNVNLLFDDALHPELRLPVFDNRLQYDSAEGPQIVDLWPDIDKDKVRLDLHLDNVAGFVVNAGGVWAETKNQYTRYSSEYAGYVLNAARRLGDSWRLRWRGRVYTIDNDDVWIDTNDRPAIAGPHAPNTYEDIYGVNYDHWRYSNANRDAFESKLDLSYRISRSLGTLKLQWDYESLDREYTQVLPGETETTTNLVGVSWNARPAKGLSLYANVRHAAIDNPFILVDGACSTIESGSYPNPWDPTTPQYDDQHQSRIAETTASPSSYNKAKLGLSYTFGGATTLSGTYHYWDGDNTDGDLNDWSRTNHNATVTLWSAPAESWDWYVAYALQTSQLDAPMCTPIMDG